MERLDLGKTRDRVNGKTKKSIDDELSRSDERGVYTRVVISILHDGLRMSKASKRDDRDNGRESSRQCTG
jgi:hypothetical protein